MSSMSARSVRTAPAPRRERPAPSSPTRPPLRAVPPRPARPGRAPFVALVVCLLAGGLVGLLLLNTALAEGAFTVYDLKARNVALADREQKLEQDVAAASAPELLATRARDLGMVPTDAPGFVDIDATSFRGQPQPAEPPPPPPAPSTGSTEEERSAGSTAGRPATSDQEPVGEDR